MKYTIGKNPNSRNGFKKGVLFSVLHKKRLSETHIRIKTNPPSRKGSHLTKESRLKISKAFLGEKSNGWKGGITPENIKIRTGIEIRLWREAVFARDNWTCQKTKVKGCKLHSHHIQNFADFPLQRFAIDNGITL